MTLVETGLTDGSGRYMYWDVLDEIPEGRKIDKTTGSPLSGYVFAKNGLNLMTGKQKRVLVPIVRK